MGFQCIDLDESGIRLKKYKVEISPFLQSKTGFHSVIFTNDIEGLINSLTSSYGKNAQYELSYRPFKLDEQGQARFERIKSMFLNRDEVIDNVDDYSLFIYYGFIPSKTTSPGLKVLQPQYEDKSLTVLTDSIKSIIKVIRKDILNTVITFKGNPFKFDNVALTNISLLINTMKLTGSEEIEYRLENGEYIEVNENELKEILTYGMTFNQKVVKIEKELIKEYSSLSVETLEDIILNHKEEEIKINFDKKLKEVL